VLATTCPFDTRPFSGYGQQLTLRSLGSDLLECILARTDITCVSVAPIFEATFVNVARPHVKFEISLIDHDGPEQHRRNYNMIRAALAHRLSAVDILLYDGVVSPIALSTAIAALRQHKSALRGLRFVCQRLVGYLEAQVEVPSDLTTAIGDCTQVARLNFVEAVTASRADVSRVLPMLTNLRFFHYEGHFYDTAVLMSLTRLTTVNLHCAQPEAVQLMAHPSLRTPLLGIDDLHFDNVRAVSRSAQLRLP